MPAFQPYAGAYDHDGARVSWRCYATARVHDLRLADHAPFPEPPDGMKWIWPPQKDERRDFACLVDSAVEDFSQILVQVTAEPASGARTSIFPHQDLPAPPQQP